MVSVLNRTKKYSLSFIAGLLLVFSGATQAQEEAQPQQTPRSWSLGSMLNTALIFAPTALQIAEQIGSLSSENQQATFGTVDASASTTACVCTLLSAIGIDPGTIHIKKLDPRFRNSAWYAQNLGVYATNTALFIDEDILKNFPALQQFLITNAAYTQIKNNAYRNIGLFSIGLTATKALSTYYLMRLGTQAIHAATNNLGWHSYTQSSNIGISALRFMIDGIAMPMILNTLIQHASNHTTHIFMHTQQQPLCNDATDMNCILKVLLDLFAYAQQYTAYQPSAYAYIQKIMTACLEQDNIHIWKARLLAYKVSLLNKEDISHEYKAALINLQSYCEQIQSQK